MAASVAQASNPISWSVGQANPPWSISLPPNASTESTLADFEAANHADLVAVSAAIGGTSTTLALESTLSAFAAANIDALSSLSAGLLQVSGSTAAGMPGVLMMGTVFTGFPPTFQDGWVGGLQLDSSGSLKVSDPGLGTTDGYIQNIYDLLGLAFTPKGSAPNPGSIFSLVSQVNTSAPTYSSDGVLEPLSLTGDGALRVDGSAVTQPVSLATAPALVASNASIGSVSIDAGQTIGVTGTFYQATQPVSIATMPSTPVTGTFWQSTQPVSLTALPVLATGTNTIGSVTVLNPTSSTVTVNSAATGALTISGTATVTINTAATGTQPVSLASLPVLATGSNTIGSVTVLNPTSSTVTVNSAATGALTIAGTATVTINTAATGTQPVSLTSLPVLATGSNTIGSVTVLNPTSSTVTINSAATGALTVSTGNITINSAATGAVTISGTVTANAGTGTLTTAEATTGGNPCQNPQATLLSVAGATSGTAKVQIIALSGSTKIYVCALTVIGVAGTSPTFSLVSGTGSNCASATTTVVQAFGATANQLYQFANPVLVTTGGHELCYLEGGTSSPNSNYQVTYVQQ